MKVIKMEICKTDLNWVLLEVRAIKLLHKIPIFSSMILRNKKTTHI